MAWLIDVLGGPIGTGPDGLQICRITGLRRCAMHGARHCVDHGTPRLVGAALPPRDIAQKPAAAQAKTT
jgi:hypothetical protein